MCIWATEREKRETTTAAVRESDLENAIFFVFYFSEDITDAIE